VALPVGHAEPVTTAHGVHSELVFVSAGRTTASVPLAQPLGQGAEPAIAPAAGNLVIVDPGGGQLFRTNQSGAVVARLRPRGLPSGVVAVSFADAQRGWAVATTSRCFSGKNSCTPVTTVLATADGGRAWRPILGGR
jgi:hypothetical protein